MQQHKHNNEQGPLDVLPRSSENSWDTIPDCRILLGSLQANDDKSRAPEHLNTTITTTTY